MQRSIEVSADTCRRWLHSLGWVWKRAKLVARDDDPQRIRKLARIRFCLENLARQAALVFADELDIHLLPKEDSSAPLLDGVISGLPFANFPPSLRDLILDNVRSALKPQGKFIAFQYSLRLKSRLEKRFEKVTTSLVPLNVPPAFVHVCEGPRDN